MALFGGQRDMDLFNKLNKELINDIIDTQVYYYMVATTETDVNLYGCLLYTSDAADDQ